MATTDYENLPKAVLSDLLRKEKERSAMLEKNLHKEREKLQQVDVCLKGAKVGLFDWYPKTGDFHFERRPFDRREDGPLQKISKVEELVRYIHPDDAQRQLGPEWSLEQYKKRVPEPWKHDFRLKVSKGKYIWVQLVGTAFLDDQGNVRHVAGIYREITSEKERQMALEDTESQFKILGEMAQEGAMLCKKEVIIDVNRAILGMMGLPEEDLMGKGIGEFFDKETCQFFQGQSNFEKYHYFQWSKGDGSRIHLKAAHKHYGIDQHFVIISDISRRVAAEEHLLRYQKELEEIVRERTIAFEKQNEILVQREKSYSTLLYNLQGMAYRYVNDGQWKMVFASDGSKALTGYRPEDFVKNEVRVEKDLLVAEYVDPIWEEINDKLDKKESFKVTYPIVTRSGEEKWVFDRGVGVYDEQGKLKCLEGVIIDITEQKEKELQLRLAQLTIDSAPVAIEWIAEDGTFLYVNDQMRRELGYEKEDFQDKKVYEISRSLDKKEWGDIFKQRKHQAIRDKEVKCYRKDGTSFPALISASNIEYEGTVYNCAYVNNITKVKKAERRLQEAYNDLSASEEELRQQSEALALLNEDLENRKGKLESTIYELQQTQKQLIQAEKMASLGVLAAGIAHELNNPINYVSTSTDALGMILEDVLEVIHRYDALDKGDVANELEEIKMLRQSVGFKDLIEDIHSLSANINSGVEKAAEIIKGLKTFSGTDRGVIEHYDIHDIIDDALLILHNSYKLHITIIKDYVDIPKIECYPNKLSQVFVNIIGNAIQSIEKKGEIYITTRLSRKEPEGGFVEVAIRDTGSGIPKEEQYRIFEPFYTTKGLGEGTGLGLSITLGLVEDHAGFIEVESDLGKGSEFRVYLPIHLSQLIG